MKELEIRLPKSELERFNKVIDDMVKATGRELKTVVRNASRDITRIALQLTKSAPSKRTMKFGKSSAINVPEYRLRFIKRKKKTGGGNTPYWVITKNKHTGEEVVFPSTAKDAEKYSKFGMEKEVTNRGFMKAGWVMALYKLGVKGVQPVKSLKFGQVEEVSGFSDYKLIISNQVPFIVQWDTGRNRWHTPQNLIENSIMAVSSKWETKLKEMLNKPVH